MTRSCPLCKTNQVPLWIEVHGQTYYQCSHCQLIFLDPSQLPTPAQEKKKYDEHQNSPADLGYRQFLSPAMKAVLDLPMPKDAVGLDYGCGPGPTLSKMLEEHGYRVHDYDPLYQNNTALLAQFYDFVTCTEVVEHFHDVAQELDNLFALVAPGGVCVIMTLFFDDPNAFKDSHYHRDPTHVAFFSRPVFQWWADTHHVQVDFPSENIVRVYKPKAIL